MNSDVRLIFWELTAACNLKCKHCRAEAQECKIAGELTTEQIINTARSIREYADPIMILTGGEPLVRKDFFEIAAECNSLFSRVALATNGTVVDEPTAKKIKAVGIQRVSISLDGSTAEVHDEFRGQRGSFDNAIKGGKLIQQQEISLQINTTVTRSNYDDLENILQLALDMEVDAFHVFILVPVGCGVEIADDQRIDPDKLENALKWLFEKSMELKDKIHIKATCAPQYYRLMHQMSKEAGVKPSSGHPGGKPPATSDHVGHGHSNGMSAMTRGCLAGSAVCFISRIGDVQPCGYLPVKVGNILESDFKDIWENSEVFNNLRDVKTLEGKCGACGYRKLCQGCRARAYAETGNYLSEDPDCIYESSN